MSKHGESKEFIPVDAVIDVWVAYKNTDLTEGRGRNIVHAVAESPETAERLGRKQNVQGGDCIIEQMVAFKKNGIWLIPGEIRKESREDRTLRQRREKREIALRKAREAGLSEEDIMTLMGGK